MSASSALVALSAYGSSSEEDSDVDVTAAPRVMRRRKDSVDDAPKTPKAQPISGEGVEISPIGDALESLGRHSGVTALGASPGAKTRRAIDSITKRSPGSRSREGKRLNAALLRSAVGSSRNLMASLLEADSDAGAGAGGGAGAFEPDDHSAVAATYAEEYRADNVSRQRLRAELASAMASDIPMGPFLSPTSEACALARAASPHTAMRILNMDHVTEGHISPTRSPGAKEVTNLDSGVCATTVIIDSKDRLKTLFPPSWEPSKAKEYAINVSKRDVVPYAVCGNRRLIYDSKLKIWTEVCLSDDKELVTSTWPVFSNADYNASGDTRLARTNEGEIVLRSEKLRGLVERSIDWWDKKGRNEQTCPARYYLDNGSFIIDIAPQLNYEKGTGIRQGMFVTMPKGSVPNARKLAHLVSLPDDGDDDL